MSLHYLQLHCNITPIPEFLLIKNDSKRDLMTASALLFVFLPMIMKKSVVVGEKSALVPNYNAVSG